MSRDLTAYEQRIIECVDEFGCFVVNVFGDEDDSPFSYSVGFTKSLNAPEVIFQGLSGESGQALINDLFEMCSNGLMLQDGQPIDNLIKNYLCVPRRVDESWIIQSCFASALWFYRTQMNRSLTEIFQMVWPDEDGRFPWEDGCADWVMEVQPAMYEPRSTA